MNPNTRISPRGIKEVLLYLIQDLHRTGCSSYCGQEAEQDRVVLKRVLLAYARWNKSVGYCQGFNVLAALILEVTEGHESDALKVNARTHTHTHRALTCRVIVCDHMLKNKVKLQ